MIANSRKISNHFPARAHVVGTIHSPACLRKALALKAGDLDLLELRADAFSENPEVALAVLPKLKIPLIVTVRHFLEGGTRPMDSKTRLELFERFLPHAACIDVELRSVATLAEVIATARAGGVRLIFSHHEFRNTPSNPRLRALIRKAASADAFKIAALTSKPRDVAALLALFESKSAVPLSVMGMGRFGKVSRLLFAQAGSVLNYGYLHAPQVSGQWPAMTLKKRIGELLEAE